MIYRFFIVENESEINTKKRLTQEEIHRFFKKMLNAQNSLSGIDLARYFIVIDLILFQIYPEKV